jgi:hypothetical protein
VLFRSRSNFQPPLFGFAAVRAIGGLLIVAGLPVLLDSFVRFAIQGLGTLAPIMNQPPTDAAHRYFFMLGSSPALM